MFEKLKLKFHADRTELEGFEVLSVILEHPVSNGKRQTTLSSQFKIQPGC